MTVFSRFYEQGVDVQQKSTFYKTEEISSAVAPLSDSLTGLRKDPFATLAFDFAAAIDI